MQTWIALLRGINVGGKNKVPMAALRTLFENQGCSEVKTYIQSGNVVFHSAATDAVAIAAGLVEAIEAQFGFRVPVMVLCGSDLKKALDANPFPEAEAEAKSLHLFFLSNTPEQPDMEGLARWKIQSESYELKGRVFYLHTPDGFGRSKLASRIEKLLGVRITARNWRSASEILALATAL